VKLLPASELEHAIRQRFEALKLQGLKPDNITFAGNGEPTMHPGFPAIIDLTVELRNRYFPESQITVLSNSTRLHIPAVKEALMKIDNNVLKLDAGSELMYRRINRPSTPVTLAEIVEQLAGFKGNLIVQSLFLKGSVNGEPVDNTTPEEIRLWKEHIVKIKPSLVMLYSFSRETPEKELQRISKETLQQIAGNLEGSGIPCEVFD
jgi:wyosine [tRNA(Phe)-imidazoG37] synthetase (radical SAM superfamily)